MGLKTVKSASYDSFRRLSQPQRRTANFQGFDARRGSRASERTEAACTQTHTFVARVYPSFAMLVSVSLFLAAKRSGREVVTRKLPLQSSKSPRARSFAPIDRAWSVYAFENTRRGNACIPKSSALADSRETTMTSAA